MVKDDTEVVNAVGDYALFAFYYLFQVGGSTVKRQRNVKKKTVKFKS